MRSDTFNIPFQTSYKYVHPPKVQLRSPNQNETRNKTKYQNWEKQEFLTLQWQTGPILTISSLNFEFIIIPFFQTYELSVTQICLNFCLL